VYSFQIKKDLMEEEVQCAIDVICPGLVDVLVEIHNNPFIENLI